MQNTVHPLESFFRQAVRKSYEGNLGWHDPDLTGYVAHLLCEFSEADRLYKEAAECKPADAMQRLDAEHARQETGG